MFSRGVSRLIGEDKLTAAKFRNKWLMERDQLHEFFNSNDGSREGVRRLL